MDWFARESVCGVEVEAFSGRLSPAAEIPSEAEGAWTLFAQLQHCVSGEFLPPLSVAETGTRKECLEGWGDVGSSQVRKTVESPRFAKSRRLAGV